MNNDLLQTMDAEESCVLKIIAVRSARQDFESSDYHFAYKTRFKFLDLSVACMDKIPLGDNFAEDT